MKKCNKKFILLINIMRQETLKYIKNHEQYFIKDEPVYDMGGGNWQKYDMKSLIGGRDLVVVDQFEHKTVSIVDDLHTLATFKDNSICNIISSDAIEHCDNPWEVIKTFHRVMKPDGVLFITAPFIWHYHGHKRDDGVLIDLWRFTPLGLQKLCEKYFDIIDCDWDTKPPSTPNKPVWRCGAHILAKRKDNITTTTPNIAPLVANTKTGGW